MNKIKSKDTLIEPNPSSPGQYQVVAQDSTVPIVLFCGTWDDCLQWQKDNE